MDTTSAEAVVQLAHADPCVVFAFVGEKDECINPFLPCSALKKIKKWSREISLFSKVCQVVRRSKDIIKRRVTMKTLNDHTAAEYHQSVQQSFILQLKGRKNVKVTLLF